MLKIQLVVLLLLVFVHQSLLANNLLHKQNGYKLVHHHIEKAFVNSEYLSLDIYYKRIARNSRTFSYKLVFSKRIPDIVVTTNLYKFLSNEYRDTFMRFSFSMCKALKLNAFGVTEYKGNVTCPYEIGTYYVDEFLPNDKKLPPNVPFGDYRLNLIFSYSKIKLVDLDWYGSVISNKVN